MPCPEDGSLHHSSSLDFLGDESRVSCGPGWHGTHYVIQAGFKLLILCLSFLSAEPMFITIPSFQSHFKKVDQ